MTRQIETRNSPTPEYNKLIPGMIKAVMQTKNPARIIPADGVINPITPIKTVSIPAADSSARELYKKKLWEEEF